MKIDIIFVHFAVVIAVCVPYILFVLAAAKERKKIKRNFENAAKELNLKLDQIDKWNSNIIGIDKSQQKILLLQRRKESFYKEVIDLKKVKSSSILPERRTIKINKKNEELLQRVDLELTLYSGEKHIVNLFDSEMTYSQDYEMKNAEKWNRVINEALGLRPVVHVAA